MNILLNHAAEILILLFLTITFLQSGIDKITDWKGNLSFIKGHFENSPLKNTVPLLLGIVFIIQSNQFYYSRCFLAPLAIAIPFAIETTEFFIFFKPERTNAVLAKHSVADQARI